MTLRRVGFFRELRHGFPDGPSLHACKRGDWNGAGQAVSYLRKGNVVAATGSLADDVLDPKKTRVAPLAVLSDGIWVWPADLAYYVETYACELPPDFVNHMREQGWTPRVLTPEELIQLGEEFYNG